MSTVQDMARYPQGAQFVTRQRSTRCIYTKKWQKRDDVKMQLQELCKARKAALRLTHEEIAKQSGIPAQTIKNFFSKNSKAPSIYTVAPICKVLGISLDEFFEITEHLTPTEETLQAEKDGLEKRLSNKRETIDTQNHAIELMEKGLQIRNHIILTMFIIMIGLLAWCIYVDLHCMDIGFWRG